MALSYRQCTIDDADQLALLVEAWIREERRPASQSLIRAGLARFLGDNHQGHAWIIEQHDVPVGYAMLGISALDNHGAPRGYVTALYIEPAHRRQGIGPRTERFLADVTRWLQLPLYQFGTGDEGKHASLLFRPCGLGAAQYRSRKTQAVA